MKFRPLVNIFLIEDTIEQLADMASFRWLLFVLESKLRNFLFLVDLFLISTVLVDPEKVLVEVDKSLEEGPVGLPLLGIPTNANCSIDHPHYKLAVLAIAPHV